MAGFSFDRRNDGGKEVFGNDQEKRGDVGGSRGDDSNDDWIGTGEVQLRAWDITNRDGRNDNEYHATTTHRFDISQVFGFPALDVNKFSDR